MEHLAIDLGGRESQICVRSSDGEIVEEKRITTARIGGYLRGRAAARVIVETGAESFAIADQALALGHEVRVVPGSLVRALGVGARGIKNDQRDARALSEVSCRIDLPSVHIPSERARELKAVCNMREALVETRTKLINTVRGWLRTQVRRIRRGGTPTFGARVREHFASTQAALPMCVERVLESIEQLSGQIRAADREVERLAKDSEVGRRLLTVPGVGPVTATRFMAVIDDVRRFSDAHAVASYLGLTPGENTTGFHVKRTSITKAGPPKLRWALVQAAWAARRSRGPLDPMVQWSQQVEQRRGKRIAIVALARKIAGVMYALWRDGSTYDPLQMMNGAR